jgi:hypothetical protein
LSMTGCQFTTFCWLHDMALFHLQLSSNWPIKISSLASIRTLRYEMEYYNAIENAIETFLAALGHPRHKNISPFSRRQSDVRPPAQMELFLHPSNHGMIHPSNHRTIETCLFQGRHCNVTVETSSP